MRFRVFIRESLACLVAFVALMANAAPVGSWDIAGKVADLRFSTPGLQATNLLDVVGYSRGSGFQVKVSPIQGTLNNCVFDQGRRRKLFMISDGVFEKVNYSKCPSDS